jgi:hypothetical protein
MLSDSIDGTKCKRNPNTWNTFYGVARSYQMCASKNEKNDCSEFEKRTNIFQKILANLKRS